MSAEHFQTFLTCDMATAPNGRDVIYVERQTGEPRGLGGGYGVYIEGYLYAHNVLRIAADTIRSDPMDGLSGDLPDKREQAAAIIETAARLVRYLACDDACDGEVTEEGWAAHLETIRVAAGAA